MQTRDQLPPPRVLVVGVGGTYGADSMEWHVVDSLRHMGCVTDFVGTRLRVPSFGGLGDAVASKLAPLIFREPERLSERSLLNAIRSFEPTLVLVILGSNVSPKTIAAMRRATKAPIVCWCQDQMTTLGRQYLLGAGYDAVFVKDRYMQDLFSRMIRSTSFHYLAEACNPRVHRPIELSAEEQKRYGCEVGIAGTLYYYRQEVLKQLKEFDLKVWGNVPDWLVNELGERHMGREVILDDKAKAFRAARISLNTLHFAEIDALNCRAFELAGCGAFQLITARPVLDEHFKPGVDLDSFDSVDVLIDKIHYYLKNPDLAASIARQGQLRAHREHSYEARLNELLAISLGRGDRRVLV